MKIKEKQYHNELVNNMRPYILSAMKEVFGDKCALCGLQFMSYEVDHKRYASDITIFDLQLLCSECHAEKTRASGDMYVMQKAHCDTCTCYHL